LVEKGSLPFLLSIYPSPVINFFIRVDEFAMAFLLSILIFAFINRPVIPRKLTLAMKFAILPTSLIAGTIGI
jgi:hypothetical protein